MGTTRRTDSAAPAPSSSSRRRCRRGPHLPEPTSPAAGSARRAILAQELFRSKKRGGSDRERSRGGELRGALSERACTRTQTPRVRSPKGVPEELGDVKKCPPASLLEAHRPGSVNFLSKNWKD